MKSFELILGSVNVVVRSLEGAGAVSVTCKVPGAVDIPCRNSLKPPPSTLVEGPGKLSGGGEGAGDRGIISFA